jgi:hypothetical protein
MFFKRRHTGGQIAYQKQKQTKQNPKNWLTLLITGEIETKTQ